jgi:DNA polymerase III epsilon subunit-like protein
VVAAVAEGQALAGRREARARLWEHVDANTVMVGQSLNFDLRALRVLHAKILDSAIITAEARFGKTRRLGSMVGLERLCQELLGLRIRGGGIHDSLEDAPATRELVIWCLRNPKDLKSWAFKNWKQTPPSKNKKKEAPGMEGPWSGQYATPHWTSNRDDDDDDDEYDESLRWEDVVDYETWPKSPNWSD